MQKIEKAIIIVTQFLPRGDDPHLRGTGVFVGRYLRRVPRFNLVLGIVCLLQMLEVGK